MADVIDRTVFEELLLSIPSHASVSARVTKWLGESTVQFDVSGYAGGDCVTGTHIYTNAATLDEAIAKFHVAHDEALTARKKLRTAAECKAAVIDLIREHDAAPASFRDAVDALQVSDR